MLDAFVKGKDSNALILRQKPPVKNNYQLTGVDAEWLLTGKGDMYGEGRKQKERTHRSDANQNRVIKSLTL